MSIFNYTTKRDSTAGLASRIAKLEKIFRNLKFWEVNDVSQGSNILRRRKVTPSLLIGSVGHGEWHDVLGMGNSALADSGGMDWAKCSFGYKVNPDRDNKAEVRIYVGDINRNASTQTDLVIAGTVEISVTKYVYARVTIATPSTILITQANAVPADDATYKYYRLYRFTSNLIVGSTPAAYRLDDDLTQIYRPFDIEDKELPTPGADGQLLQSNGMAWVSGWGRMKII